MVRVLPSEVAKASGALKEMLNKEKDEETGEEYDVLLSLKYFFPAVPKPNEKAKPLFPDQLLQNTIFKREFSKLWKWCQEETKNRVMESAMRAQLKRQNSKLSDYEESSKEKSTKESNESSTKERKSEENAKAKSNSNASGSGTFGGADGVTFNKYETIALQELSINRLKFWIEEDEDAAIKKKKDQEDQTAKESKKLHEQFVKQKDR